MYECVCVYVVVCACVVRVVWLCVHVLRVWHIYVCAYVLVFACADVYMLVWHVCACAYMQIFLRIMVRVGGEWVAGKAKTLFIPYVYFLYSITSLIMCARVCMCLHVLVWHVCVCACVLVCAFVYVHLWCLSAAAAFCSLCVFCASSPVISMFLTPFFFFSLYSRSFVYKQTTTNAL